MLVKRYDLFKTLKREIERWAEDPYQPTVHADAGEFHAQIEAIEDTIVFGTMKDVWDITEGLNSNHPQIPIYGFLQRFELGTTKPNGFTVRDMPDDVPGADFFTCAHCGYSNEDLDAIKCCFCVKLRPKYWTCSVNNCQMKYNLADVEVVCCDCFAEKVN